MADQQDENDGDLMCMLPKQQPSVTDLPLLDTVALLGGPNSILGRESLGGLEECGRKSAPHTIGGIN